MIYASRVEETYNTRLNKHKNSSFKDLVKINSELFDIIMKIYSIFDKYKYTFVEDSTISNINMEIHYLLDEYNKSDNNRNFIVMYDNITKEEIERAYPPIKMNEHIKIKSKITNEIRSLNSYLREVGKNF